MKFIIRSFWSFRAVDVASWRISRRIFVVINFMWWLSFLILSAVLRDMGMGGPGVERVVREQRELGGEPVGVHLCVLFRWGIV